MFDLDPAALSLPARVDALIESEREIARVQARQVRVIAAIADDPYSDVVAPLLEREFFKEEIRAALGESAESVNGRLLLARSLVHRLSATLAAVESGSITLRHARHLVDAVRLLDDTDALAVEDAVLVFAVGRDFGAFCRKVRREVLKADSRSVEAQVAAAVAERRVWARPLEHGMSVFGALLPADGAQALMLALDVLADRCAPEDPRTRDQQRADALVQLALDSVDGFSWCPTCVAQRDTSEGTRWQGMRPSIQVSVALSTLLRLDEQPGELEGYGPIPAEVVRQLAGAEDASWRRLITDEAGRLLDYGRSTYRPPADLRDFVVARDRTCRFPTCNRKACRCEIDHVHAWQHGGHTNPDNLVALCCRHHHGKHDAGWRLKRLPDGSIEWTSPTGHSYLVPASTYPVDGTYDMYVHHDNDEHPAAEADPDPPSLATRASRPSNQSRGRSMRRGQPPVTSPSMSIVDEQGRTEPPSAADETATLLGFLDFHRETLAWKCGGLDANGLAATIATSTMTLGGMLKHLAYVEDLWCSRRLHGRAPEPPWDTVDWSADADWDWHSAADDTPEQLFTLWQDAVERSRSLVTQALADGGLDGLAATDDRGEPPSLRWILVHMIEEYARHNGHADILREAIDGQTGE